MSGSLNRVELIGNACSNPEIRSTQNGDKVANFSLATNESYTTKEGKKIDSVEYHRLVFWKGLAEVCDKFVKQGSQIFIEGKLKTRKWEKDGDVRYSTEIACKNLILLGSKSIGTNNRIAENNKGETNHNTTQDNSSYSTPTRAYPSSQEDDLPF